MAKHIRILHNELYCTCPYGHPCSWSKLGEPNVLGLRRCNGPQYWLGQGHISKTHKILDHASGNFKVLERHFKHCQVSLTLIGEIHKNRP